MDAAMSARFDALESQLHELRGLVQRLAVPVSLLAYEAVCDRVGRSRSSLERAVARGVFSDARDAGARKQGSKRLFFSDEVEAFVLDGEAGVARIRKLLARL